MACSRRTTCRWPRPSRWTRLHPQPVDGPLDARLLVVAHEVHAVVRLAGPEDRDLGDPEPVGDEVLDEEPAEAVRGRERVDVPIVVVGAYLGDHGDLAALGHGPSVPVATVDHGEPQPEVHLRTTGDAGPAIGRVDAGDGDVDGPNLVDLVAPVPPRPWEDVGVVVEHMPLLSSTGGSQWSTSLSGDAGSLPKQPESGAEDMSSTIRERDEGGLRVHRDHYPVRDPRRWGTARPP